MPRILVIDDEVQMQKALESLLVREGYQVNVASEGSEGIKACDNWHFDLIITDVIMPGKEGLETILELKQYRPLLRIIAISGGGNLGPGKHLSLAEKMGADFTMCKPFTSDEVLSAVRALLDGKYVPKKDGMDCTAL